MDINSFFNYHIICIYTYINVWWPWLSFFNLNWILQLSIIYLSILIFFYNGIYYVLMNIFINFVLIGIYLSLLQLDLFTAFLWLLEFTIIFIFLLLLFYLNIKNSTHKNKKKHYTFFILFLFFFLNIISSIKDQCANINSYYFNLIDNFYEGYKTYIKNDFFGIFISYFYLNSLIFLIIGFLLLVGSVICVNFFKKKKEINSQNYNSYLNSFNFLKDFLNFDFLRKQNLVNQGNEKSSIKIFKKK